MNRDPLWQSIKRAMQEVHLDPACFERCIPELLREAYPSLVPVVGGQDAGMDGAVGSNEGPNPAIFRGPALRGRDRNGKVLDGARVGRGIGV